MAKYKVEMCLILETNTPMHVSHLYMFEKIFIHKDQWLYMESIYTVYSLHIDL